MVFAVRIIYEIRKDKYEKNKKNSISDTYGINAHDTRCMSG